MTSDFRLSGSGSGSAWGRGGVRDREGVLGLGLANQGGKRKRGSERERGRRIKEAWRSMGNKEQVGLRLRLRLRRLTIRVGGMICDGDW